MWGPFNFVFTTIKPCKYTFQFFEKGAYGNIENDQLYTRQTRWLDTSPATFPCELTPIDSIHRIVINTQMSNFDAWNPNVDEIPNDSWFWSIRLNVEKIIIKKNNWIIHLFWLNWSIQIFGCSLWVQAMASVLCSMSISRCSSSSCDTSCESISFGWVLLGKTMKNDAGFNQEKTFGDINDNNSKPSKFRSQNNWCVFVHHFPYSFLD